MIVASASDALRTLMIKLLHARGFCQTGQIRSGDPRRFQGRLQVSV